VILLPSFYENAWLVPEMSLFPNHPSVTIQPSTLCIMSYKERHKMSHNKITAATFLDQSIFYSVFKCTSFPLCQSNTKYAVT